MEAVIYVNKKKFVQKVSNPSKASGGEKGKG
jgi:hypothetical protein